MSLEAVRNTALVLALSAVASRTAGEKRVEIKIESTVSIIAVEMYVRTDAQILLCGPGTRHLV